MKTAACICLLLLLGMLAAAKERDWQEGKLIDVKTESARYTVQISYVIDGGQYVYTASHQRRTNQKTLPLTVNAKIKYAIEKQKVYIVDEEGKEHELTLEKRALKEK